MSSAMKRATPTGRVVACAEPAGFRHALSRTVIFTSTVMFDTRIVPKAQIRMPDMASEDTALWWTILKTGVTAYGMDRALTVYRRPAQSLSSNKKSSVKRLWNLLLKVAGCSKIAAFFHLIGWAFHATMRRIWFRRITNHVDCWNRAVVLLSGLAEAVIAVLIYAIYWFSHLLSGAGKPQNQPGRVLIWPGTQAVPERSHSCAADLSGAGVRDAARAAGK